MLKSRWETHARIRAITSSHLPLQTPQSMTVQEDVRRVWSELLPAETHGPAETLALGRRLACGLGPGCVVALHGELGAGKTHLVKGFCGALGVEEDAVTSPTFTLVHEYAGRDLPIYHLDAYRATSEAEWHELGVEEYLYGGGLCLIEWPERLSTLLPEDALHLAMRHGGGNRRVIELIEPENGGKAEQ